MLSETPRLATSAPSNHLQQQKHSSLWALLVWFLLIFLDGDLQHLYCLQLSQLKSSRVASIDLLSYISLVTKFLKSLDELDHLVRTAVCPDWSVTNPNTRPAASSVSSSFFSISLFSSLMVHLRKGSSSLQVLAILRPDFRQYPWRIL